MKELANEANETIDKWTRIAHTAFVKVLILAGSIPAGVVSYYLYYTTDLGSDAFFNYNYNR